MKLEIADVIALLQPPRASDAVWYGESVAPGGHVIRQWFNWNLHAQILAHPDRKPDWRPAA